MHQATIIGAGAAGFFLAIRLKALQPSARVVILERTQHTLAKVRVSGGGRCNCTNTFEGVTDLANVYPRGHRLLRKLFHNFSPADAFQWFESHGVKLAIMPDNCVFPASQNSESIIDCLSLQARRLGVEVITNQKDIDLDDLLSRGDVVAVCTGGAPKRDMYDWLNLPDDQIVPPVPSLFTFSIKDANLNALMGTVADNATLSLAGTPFKANGPLLITHWGVSGPATLRLSSYAARHLADTSYRATLLVNWMSMSEDDARAQLSTLAKRNAQKFITNAHPEALSSRLWQYLASRSLPDADSRRWADLGKKEFNKLVATLTTDPYAIAGRAPFKDEFVTAGGVALAAVNSKSLESKTRPNLFFAGEVLDIDGVTGGFNFQAAWTTAWTAANAMSLKMTELESL